MGGQPYQSLYRRFRPQRFAELRGQPHVVTALTAAVREGRVGHAYLFSGPRGTGKTSAARILAKALNCTAAQGGEPCGSCESCVAVTAGSSLDVQELDAASHNGVEAMRELVARAPLGSPGRWKVYIVDEVHMLSTAASNALLKTLEEPPGHVVFVLATTDPHKVLPTIRSRTQHFEFRLLGRSDLRELVDEVNVAAGLDAGEQLLEAALRRGRGSARDTLSALDQLVLTGDPGEDVGDVSRLIAAVADGDTAGVLGQVAAAVATGRDPQRLAADVVDSLRQSFLGMVAPELASGAPEPPEAPARRMGLPGLVRSMETLGRAQVEMREALQPRLVLELALFDLARSVEGAQVGEAALPRSSGGGAPDGLGPVLQRLSRLEQQVAELSSTRRTERFTVGSPPMSAERTQSPVSAMPTADMPNADMPTADMPTPGGTPSIGSLRGRLGPPPRRRTDQEGPRREDAGRGPGQPLPPPTGLGDLRPSRAPSTGTGTGTGPGPGTGTVEVEPTGSAATATWPTREELVLAWGDKLLGALTPRARARFRAGRFVGADRADVTFGLPDETHRAFCEACQAEVENALRSHFGVPLSLRLVVDRPAGLPSSTGRSRTGPQRSRANSGQRPPSQPGRLGSDRPPAAGAGVGGDTEGTSGSAPDPGLEDEVIDLDDLVGEPEGIGTVEERLIQAFPGATEVADGLQ
ncbi:MAG: DNA polymerase III subunit gamma/tau [Actinomycetota bacterium]|nr:DNA polymerase III subunit gamma/tau [Actinomycetota bacterium]